MQCNETKKNAQVSLDCRGANVVELRRRYAHMYVPSDFVDADFHWPDTLPRSRPLPLDRPVAYHVFDKRVDPPPSLAAAAVSPPTLLPFSLPSTCLSATRTKTKLTQPKLNLT